MVTERHSVRCTACKTALRLRIQVGYEPRQPWAAPCPKCGALLRGTFSPNQGHDSRHVEGTESGAEGEDLVDVPTLNICTDFPLPRDYVTERSPLSPSMMMQEAAKLGDLFQQQKPLLHPDFEDIGLRFEQLVESHLNGNGKQFRLIRTRLLEETRLRGLKNLDHGTALRLIFRALAAPTEDQDHMHALDELRNDMRGVARRWATLRARAEQDLLDAGGLDGWSQQAWRAASNLAQRVGALLASQVAVHIRDQGLNLADFRAVRGDYEELASAYARAFEAVSKGIALCAYTHDLATGGDGQGNVDGSRMTLKRRMGIRAVDREPLAPPAVKRLYDTISRNRRNEIGHHLDRYDFASGDLVNTDGTREGFLPFLIELQAFFRLTDWLVELVASWEELLRTGHLPEAMRRNPDHPWPDIDPEPGDKVFFDPVHGPTLMSDLLRRSRRSEKPAPDGEG